MYYIRGMWRAATEDLSPGKIFVPYGGIVVSFVDWLDKAHRTISTKADRIREEDAVGGKKKYNFWKALSTDDHE